MILLNDAIWIFVKGLAELLQEEELQVPKVECRRNRSWPMGRRIIEFMKAVKQICQKLVLIFTLLLFL